MESERLAKEWAAVCGQIKTYSGIDASQINAFFSRLQPQATSDGFLMLTADNDFIKTWIERHYLSYIRQALKDIYGIDYNVIIEVDINQQPPAQPASEPPAQQPAQSVPVQPTQTMPANTQPVEQPNQASQSIAMAAAQAPAPQPQVEAQGIEATRDAQQDEPAQDQGLPSSTLTFENYVTGESNRMAYSMAVAVAEAPGASPALNPLFIYGKSGLGKTHLLRATQNYIMKNMPHLKTVYVDTAQLLDDYMDAAATHDKEKQSYRNFKNYYESADVLLIDDVQYLQGKTQTLNIVFQIFNNLTNQGKQVILSADRAPKNIDIDERYSSRFNSGGTFDIQPPEFEVKLGIVRNFIEEYKQKSNGRDIEVPVEIQQYIAENSSSNIRELKSAVTKVIYQINAFGRSEITLQEAKELLKNHFTGGAMKKLTVADIQKQVEAYYKVSHADLIGKKRSRNIVYARQIAIYLSRHMLDLPFSYIGKSFGGKDHTTIMYSVNNIEEKIKENLEISEELETIRRMIQEA